MLPIFLISWHIYRTQILAALPVSNGTQTVVGIQGNVDIARDRNGIVTISSSSDLDVYFAMGYVHAQDRLWQLELQRRTSQGRLSEVFGRDMVERDIWIRTLGIYPSAKEALKNLSVEAKNSLDAYARGINAWLSLNKTLPVEFLTFNIKPEPWKSEDSLAWSKMFALNLAGNFREELRAFVAAQYLDEEQIATIFSHKFSLLSDKSNPIRKNEIEGYSKILSLQDDIERELNLGNRYTGSNSWVVSGAHTKSGNPILSNDPHLGLQIPSTWYAVNQKGERLSASGMSLVGLPVVVFGRNDHIAWGGTNMMADAQDLYIEQPAVSNPSKYKIGEQWKDFETRHETIQVKPDFPSTLRRPLAPVEIQVRSSIHGPIISDVVKGVEQPVALRWTALDKDDTTYESFFRLSYASNWESFKQAVSYHVAPALNLLYADINNNIGFIGVGRIPLRNQGIGALPVRGADPKNMWNGSISFAEMPQQYNPSAGYIISANNKNIDDSYPYFISKDWALPARAERIDELLNKNISQNKKMTPELMKKIQGDNKDLAISNLLRRLQAVKGQTEIQHTALKYLSDWSGFSNKESLGATIYYQWARHLRSQIFSDEIQSYWNKREHRRYLNSVIPGISADTIYRVIEDESQWCDNINSKDIVEDCSFVIYAALQSSLEEMSKLAGSNIEDWRWGDIHQTLYPHAPFSQFKLLDTVFERRIENGGAANTINVASASFDISAGYVQSFGAGFRQIISMGQTQIEHLYMISTGQSGQVASPNYDDMVEPFRNVEFFSIDSGSKHQSNLTLIPAESTGDLQ